ncbi:MAG TPA: hypothetical protein PK413_16950, partial [Thermoanaerobaculia bacterium]|nr:hypothetical protein [Thermoanaerobaculia bacterium]
MRLHLLQHKLLLASLAVGVGLAALAFWPKALEVDTAPVARRELTVTLDEEGTTRVHHRFLISAPVAGRSLRIELDPGDPVVKGQTVLARLLPSDPTPLDARAQAEAEAAAMRLDIGDVEDERTLDAEMAPEQVRRCGSPEPVVDRIPHNSELLRCQSKDASQSPAL